MIEFIEFTLETEADHRIKDFRNDYTAWLRSKGERG